MAMYPYVAPHTAKIHTLITLGIHIRTNPLVFRARNVVLCGFDSHRPLHSGTARTPVCLRDKSSGCKKSTIVAIHSTFRRYTTARMRPLFC
jgi:hypothetical protein